MTAVIAPTINAQYAMQEEGGANLPWLQASQYEPRSTKEAVHLVAPEQSLELLAEGALANVETEQVETFLGGEEGTATVFKNVRWVILSKPSTGYAQNREDGQIIKIFRGMKFAGEWKSISRVYLACIVGNQLMLDEDGNVQVWQLKLSGMKTQWIDGGERSIVDLNKGLCKHYGVKRGWVTHLASVGIRAYAFKFEAKADAKKSSIGAMFGFAEGDNAQPLSEENQKLLFDFVSGEDFKALAADPFYLADAPAVDTADKFAVDEEESVPATLDGISF
jgi:hypothetical protein